MCLLTQRDYQPGDPAPSGYLAWHEWAEVQWKGGLRQVQCGQCSKWRFPQQLSGEVTSMKAYDSHGREHTIEDPICLDCKPAGPEGEAE